MEAVPNVTPGKYKRVRFDAQFDGATYGLPAITTYAPLRPVATLT